MAPVNKKRKLRHQNQVEELSFDPAARQEYLTGFRKRKQQRIQDAKEAALKREREERIRERRQLREQRKVDLEKHVEEVNAVLRKQNPELWQDDASGDDDDEERNENGIERDVEAQDSDLDEKKVTQDEEYVDEDKFTTVTVEPLTLGRYSTDDKPGSSTAIEGERDADATRKSRGASERTIASKSKSKIKVKKRKFRYETKSERVAVRQKQKAKNHAAKLRRTGTSR